MRKSSKINKFHLVGHSFGGYLATLYASKYPNRVSHLHLISPAGVN
jgi:pimeloyl-ACP methyl ester carboxylesterase